MPSLLEQFSQLGPEAVLWMLNSGFFDGWTEKSADERMLTVAKGRAAFEANGGVPMSPPAVVTQEQLDALIAAAKATTTQAPKAGDTNGTAPPAPPAPPA